MHEDASRSSESCPLLCPAGVYLPLLWEQSFCWKSPIALGYTRGHFSALVAMENDGYGNRGAGANLNTDDDVTVTFLPLVDSERKLLHIHFLSAQEVRAVPAAGGLSELCSSSGFAPFPSSRLIREDIFPPFLMFVDSSVSWM